jgi:hypothetical protein
MTEQICNECKNTNGEHLPWCTRFRDQPDRNIDKPEIKVGQRWTLLGGSVVTVLSVQARGRWPIVIQHDDDAMDTVCPDDLISLAPSTVKREVALYRNPAGTERQAFEIYCQPDLWVLVSEHASIEFTLLPGESAE